LRHTLALVTSGAIALSALRLAAAQPKAPPVAPAKPAQDAGVPEPSASAIHRVADAIASGIGEVEPGALVVAAPLTSDLPAPKGEALAVRVATQIAARLRSASVHPQPATLAQARGLSRAASLVHVQADITNGELRATADVYGVAANGWERVKQPAPPPRAHAFASAPLDAEVRTFLLPIVLEQASVHRAKHEETDVLAIGCGDVDSDGGHEIVIASRARVVVGKLRKGKLAIARAVPWANLAPRAPTPMREPIASVVVLGARGELLVGTTDHGAVAVDAKLAPRRALAGLPVPGAGGAACAAPAPELGALEGSTFGCDAPRADGAAPVLTMPAARFDAASALRLVGADGTTSEVVAAREPGGKLRLRRIGEGGRTVEAPIDGVGAQIALADLDLDGVPEIAFSGDGKPGDAEGDSLAVWSWRPGGFAQRLRYTTKESVRAIAACPPEERGLPALVAAVGGEVWLIR
jgi:hypothetical protein